MSKFHQLIPKEGLDLVSYSSNDLLDRLGTDVISEVVLSVLCGNNVRDLTEGLTQRRILLMNTSLLATYVKALSSYKNLNKSLTSVISKELKTEHLSKDEKSFLYWFVGLTGKSIQNVIREDSSFAGYLSRLDQNIETVSKEVQRQYGKLSCTIDNEGVQYLMQWPDLLRCMLAIGAQTLTIRGSEKSMYGKFFEKLILGSVLSILGFSHIDKNDTRKNKMVFWLSERQEKRESDATVLLKAGFGIRFDIGFIGRGNPEISLDKVSRFEREMERGGLSHNTTTIILVDTIGSNSRIVDMAQNIGGHIIQMSGTYWVYELAETIKNSYSFYSSPILSQTQDKSLAFIRKNMSNVNLNRFINPDSNNE